VPQKWGKWIREHGRVQCAWLQTPGRNGEDRVKREVNVRLGSFAREALVREQSGGPDAGGKAVSAAAVRAIRCYLEDKGTGGQGWRYPGFRRGDLEKDGKVGLRLSIDDGLWRALEAEAESQGVSSQQMIEHAALYFAAEVDAGRVTQRIIDDFDGD
jgi:hypothetical protein